MSDSGRSFVYHMRRAASGRWAVAGKRGFRDHPRMSAYHPEPTLTHVVPQPLLPLMTTTTARLVFTGVGIIVTGILWGRLYDPHAGASSWALTFLLGTAVILASWCSDPPDQVKGVRPGLHPRRTGAHVSSGWLLACLLYGVHARQAAVVSLGARGRHQLS